MPTLFRYRLAMDIAGMNPAIFSKIVAGGFYPCAPKTTLGKARLFTEDDVVALFILKHLMDRGMTPRNAGPLACAFFDMMRTNPNADRLVHLIGRRQGDCIATGADYDQLRKEGNIYTGVGEVLSEVTINIETIRKIIAAHVEYEESILDRDEDK
jgi:hypothetical protein